MARRADERLCSPRGHLLECERVTRMAMSSVYRKWGKWEKKIASLHGLLRYLMLKKKCIPDFWVALLFIKQVSQITQGLLFIYITPLRLDKQHFQVRLEERDCIIISSPVSVSLLQKINVVNDGVIVGYLESKDHVRWDCLTGLPSRPVVSWPQQEGLWPLMWGTQHP